MTEKLFRVSVAATYYDEVDVWATDKDAARKLVLEEGYADGSEHVYSRTTDPEPTLEIDAEIVEIEVFECVG